MNTQYQHRECCGKKTVTKYHNDKSRERIKRKNRGSYIQWERCLVCYKSYLDKQHYCEPTTKG